MPVKASPRRSWVSLLLLARRAAPRRGGKVHRHGVSTTLYGAALHLAARILRPSCDTQNPIRPDALLVCRVEFAPIGAPHCSSSVLGSRFSRRSRQTKAERYVVTCRYIWDLRAHHGPSKREQSRVERSGALKVYHTRGPEKLSRARYYCPPRLLLSFVSLRCELARSFAPVAFVFSLYASLMFARVGSTRLGSLLTRCEKLRNERFINKCGWMR